MLAERIVYASGGAELLEALLPAEGYKTQISLPRVFIIFLAQRPEFERRGLREAVVDIIERIEIDVKLSLPTASV